MVLADADALRHCLSELLGQCSQVRPARSLDQDRDTCEAGSGSAREVLVRVRDRGRGIPDQDAWKVFEPYYRAASVADSSMPGFGLGLALVRSTVEKMGGKLTLESEEGRGSVFAIHIPVPGSRRSGRRWYRLFTQRAPLPAPPRSITQSRSVPRSPDEQPGNRANSNIT